MVPVFWLLDIDVLWRFCGFFFSFLFEETKIKFVREMFIIKRIYLPQFFHSESRMCVYRLFVSCMSQMFWNRISDVYFVTLAHLPKFHDIFDGINTMQTNTTRLWWRLPSNLPFRSVKEFQSVISSHSLYVYIQMNKTMDLHEKLN